MPEKRPRCGFEERMCFDVGCTGTRAKTAQFVLDEEFADQRFAKTGAKLVHCLSYLDRSTYVDTVGLPACSGKGTSSLRMFANVAFLFLPLNGVVP